MLALIYSELIKRLQQIGVIDFSVDMELPTNLNDFPRPRVATQDGNVMPAWMSLDSLSSIV